MKRRILTALWILVGTYAFGFWWLNALIAIPLSESLWTFYFHLFGQEDIYLASDMELITALALGFALSCLAAKAFFIALKFRHFSRVL